MTEFAHCVQVDVPVAVAYGRWSKLEELPRFMEGVREVRQVTDTHMHWRVSVEGVEREFDALVTDQVPDRLLAWTSVDGPKQAGAVAFRPLSPDRTEVRLAMCLESEGLAEPRPADTLGAVRRRVTGDLERFKALVESRGEQAAAGRVSGHGAYPATVS